jgi:hypothetical protein
MVMDVGFDIGKENWGYLGHEVVEVSSLSFVSSAFGGNSNLIGGI